MVSYADMIHCHKNTNKQWQRKGLQKPNQYIERLACSNHPSHLLTACLAPLSLQPCLLCWKKLTLGCPISSHKLSWKLAIESVILSWKARNCHWWCRSPVCSKVKGRGCLKALVRELTELSNRENPGVDLPHQGLGHPARYSYQTVAIIATVSGFLSLPSKIKPEIGEKITASEPMVHKVKNYSRTPKIYLFHCLPNSRPQRGSCHINSASYIIETDNMPLVHFKDALFFNLYLFNKA